MVVLSKYFVGHRCSITSCTNLPFLLPILSIPDLEVQPQSLGRRYDNNREKQKKNMTLQYSRVVVVAGVVVAVVVVAGVVVAVVVAMGNGHTFAHVERYGAHKQYRFIKNSSVIQKSALW